MRHRSSIALRLSALASLALLNGCASQSRDAHASDAPAHGRFDLSCLDGAWTTQAWGGTLNADYVARNDNLVIGYTYLIKGDAPTPAYHEFEVFARDAEGDYLIPHPAGKPAPRFNLASRDTNSVTYENPEKDFPTRIVYQRINDPRLGDQLIITLSDPFNNSNAPIVFTFTPRTS